MDEIVTFLAQHPPFNLLPPARLAELAARIAIEYFAAGQPILAADGDLATHLYIIRRGSVDLIDGAADGGRVFDTLGVGEVFGHTSLLSDRPLLATARTRSEVLAYLIPKARFLELYHADATFARFFAATAIERLGHALEQRHDQAAPELFQTRLRDLVQREVVLAQPTATVQAAAQLMRQHDVSCLVIDTSPVGIVTDRDLRNRVMAAGLAGDTPLAQVMTAPALSIAAESMVFEGLLLMIERGIHHLPLTEAGRVVGLITYTDILRRQINSPLFLPRQLDRATDLAGLRAYANQVAETAGALLDAGARVSDIGRVVAIAHDALLVRLLRDAEAALGPPPCPYAWLVLGSEGRYEQTLRTDQDNALVYANDAPPEAAAYFAQLAAQVVDQLVACGFPRCPGEIMATNPRWCQPLRTWQGYFQQWISVPDPEALLRVTIFFDYRQVYGALDAEAALRPIIRRASEQRTFLARLAHATLGQDAPGGLLGWLAARWHGASHSTLDIKLRGTGLVVDLARIFALEAGCAATNTRARLQQSATASSLSEASAEELVAAFDLLSLLRMRHQRDQLRQGVAPTNLLDLGRLSPLEHRELKEALRVVAGIRDSVGALFQIGMIG